MTTTATQTPLRQTQLDEMTFNMYVDCGCSTRETARQMGISSSTVTARRRRHAQRLSGNEAANADRKARSAALDARLAALGL